ncbi:MAG: rRNA maturation RNase YbeY [Victivallales bacterium]|nr:rRNA maturation RNase YbeY [Victivallales bacterium]
MKVEIIKMPVLRSVRNLPLFKEAVEYALPFTGLDADAPGILQFVMLTRPKMTELNGLHLHHSGATDVITYDLRDGFAAEFGDEEEILGEIYFCPAVAKEQAPAFGTSASRELFLYAVHGMLHLAGEDDLTPEALASMRKAEQRVLAEVEKKFDLESFF